MTKAKETVADWGLDPNDTGGALWGTECGRPFVSFLRCTEIGAENGIAETSKTLKSGSLRLSCTGEKYNRKISEYTPLNHCHHSTCEIVSTSDPRTIFPVPEN